MGIFRSCDHLREARTRGVGSEDGVADDSPDGRLDVVMGDLKVSVTMRGRIIDFLGGRLRVPSTRDGKPFGTADCLRDSCVEISSLKNRSIPIGICFRATIPPFDAGAPFFTVPSASSADAPTSARSVSTTGRGSDDMDETRLGRTDGADMSPTHSSATIGTSIAISCTSSPRILKIKTFPYFVPTAMSVCEASWTVLFFSVASRPNSTAPSFLPLDSIGSPVTTETQVAGPATCYVRKTLPPPSKSTSRHRPSCPMLTMRDL
jgi:hypothetical protein